MLKSLYYYINGGNKVMKLLRHWHSRADARRRRGAEMGNDDSQPFPTS
jgi:hypothetical protein